MTGSFVTLVAGRYLRARRSEGFISVIAGFSFLGIMLGVATLIIVMAVMNGFRSELVQRVLGLQGHLTVYGLAGPLADHDDMADRLSGLEEVTAAYPMIEAQALVTRGSQAMGAAIRGVVVEDFLTRPSIAQNLTIRDGEDFSGLDSVAIGYRLARQLGARLGDRLTLISPQGDTTVFGTIPRAQDYEVVAIFNVGMHEYDSGFIYMPLASAQLFFQFGETVSGIDVFVPDPDSLAIPTAAIHEEIAGSARVWNWQQAQASFFNALEVERNVMFLILTLIILVAAFNVISGMVMLVKEKGRDIAILRTMGATRGMIMAVFLLTGASIGVVGTLAGLGLGVAFAENIESIRQLLQNLTGTEVFSAEIYFLTQLPADIRWEEVIAVVLIALGLSFASTLYPAWRAARLDPVEALRYE